MHSAVQSLSRALLALVGAVRTLAGWFVIISFAYMTLAVLAQVGGRYVFNYSIAGAVETATWAQIWMVLIGAGIAMRQGMHVAIDALVARLPLPVARALALLLAAAAIAFLGLIAYASQGMLAVGRIQTSSALGIRMWIVYLCLPIGVTYFALEVLLGLIARWKAPFAPTHEIDDAGIPRDAAA